MIYIYSIKLLITLFLLLLNYFFPTKTYKPIYPSSEVKHWNYEHNPNGSIEPIFSILMNILILQNCLIYFIFIKATRQSNIFYSITDLVQSITNNKKIKNNS